MAKKKTVYICQDCGSKYFKWQGQCHDCNAWNTLVEEIAAPPTDKANKRGWSITSQQEKTRTVRLHEKIQEQTSHTRSHTGYSEMDRVLGGGLVKGSYILLGGDPGIGKSTLLLQLAGGLADNGLSILYISGEESVNQTALRAQRLGIKSEHVQIASESLMENILDLAKHHNPDVLVVDSIQTVYLSELSSAPGSVSQVRECASQLMSLAKGMGISVFLIGHVTKDGQIAGPKTLEHMVDTVLSFEGDGSHQFRLLRALKNRFGATNELGVFQMATSGLTQVENPSELFLEERGNVLTGSAIYSAMEGSRPLLCEIQCLATPSPMHMPRRTSIGFDQNRVHLLVAVLDKHLNTDLCKNDVFVNVVGGLKLTEPSADLAVAAALISSAGDIDIHANTVFFGEVGLTGEVRATTYAEDRVKEAEKLGFKYFIIPESNKKHLKSLIKQINGEVIWIKQIQDLPAILKNLSRSRAKTKSRKSLEEIDNFI